MHTLRLLGVLALLAALAPLAAAQPIDCDDVPLSADAVDAAYRACTQPLALVVPEGPQDPAFGINNASGQFVRFAQNTPGSLSTICPYVPPNGAFLNAGDFMGDDFSTWYGIDNLGQAFTVDTATCDVTPLGTIGSDWTGLTWDYVTEQFYGIQVPVCGSGTRLFTVDFGTLTDTPIGGLDTSNACGIALASHPATGVLYTFDLIDDLFASIDKTTGVSTDIGPIGFDSNFGQGMDFDNEDDTCYMCAFNNATFVAELRTVNLATGNTSLVGQLGVGLQQFGACSSETNGGGPKPCDIQFLDSGITYDAGTRRLTVTVTVRNDGANPSGARLELDYNRQGGPPSGTRVLGQGTLPAGATVTRTITLRVPGAAPDGTYNFTLRLVDPDTGAGCGAYTETIAISAPRVGDAAVGGELFAVEEGTSLSPSASAVGEVEVAVSPNPFAGQTTISYAVPEAADVRLVVHDVLGREVAVLLDGPAEAGVHAATLDARGLAAGTYVYRLVVGSEVRTGRLAVVR